LESGSIRLLVLAPVTPTRVERRLLVATELPEAVGVVDIRLDLAAVVAVEVG
jgi:hypothetical protein